MDKKVISLAGSASPKIDQEDLLKKIEFPILQNYTQRIKRFQIFILFKGFMISDKPFEALYFISRANLVDQFPDIFK